MPWISWEYNKCFVGTLRQLWSRRWACRGLSRLSFVIPLRLRTAETRHMHHNPGNPRERTRWLQVIRQWLYLPALCYASWHFLRPPELNDRRLHRAPCAIGTPKLLERARLSAQYTRLV
jgi:hypothetical protein